MCANSSIVGTSGIVKRRLESRGFVFGHGLGLPRLKTRFLLGRQMNGYVSSYSFLMCMLHSLKVPITMSRLPFSPSRLTDRA